MKPRLLVVPHIYADNISVREIELARRLVSHFDVFLLKWQDALHVNAKSVIGRRARQARVALGAAWRARTQSTDRDGLRLIEVPVWQPLLFHKLIGERAALKICQLRNRATLRGIVSELGISHILLANALFGMERIQGARTFYDVVDWFPENGVSIGKLAQIRGDLMAASRQMDGIFAVSQPLCEKLARDCDVEAVPLPNGADIAGLRGVAPAKASAVRRKFGVAEDFVIGYIGNHGSYTGVDLVVNAFLAVRARIPNAKLLIVGPADYWHQLLQANRGAGVIATGAVPPAQIVEYFNAIDVGVLAQGKTSGTDFAFQIKVVEYSACRKCVVSTPLLTWQRLAWPNVILAEPNAQAWAEAFVQAHSMQWQPSWDRVAEEYDWQELANRAAKIMINVSATN